MAMAALYFEAASSEVLSYLMYHDWAAHCFKLRKKCALELRYRRHKHLCIFVRELRRLFLPPGI